MATFADKIAAARERRWQTAAKNKPAQEPETPAATEAMPVVATSAPAPKRIKRRRIRNVLLIGVRLAVLFIVFSGLVGGGVVIATLKGDLSSEKVIARVKDVPEIITAPACDFDRVNGAGCKGS